MQRPEKLSYEDYVRSMTPFYVDEAFDREVLDLIAENKAVLRDEMMQLSTREGLIEYIENNDDPFKKILSLMNLSGERFKRIVSMMRISYGQFFRTEWSLERVRAEFISNEEFREDILDLIQNGNDSRYAHRIPSYFLSKSAITPESLELLSNDTLIERGLKKVGDGKYSNDIGDMIQRVIARELNNIKRRHRIDYDYEGFVPWIHRNMDFIIPSRDNPSVIIESSYQITTGSGQTTKRNAEVAVSATIRDYNIQNGRDVAFVNFCDGAGWLARQSDLKRIYDCSDYVLNLNNLHLLEQIILHHCN